jgi:predicted GH43/DUF377 family glycosyl hydrolase
MKKMKSNLSFFSILTTCFFCLILTDTNAQAKHYIDSRPSASLRMPCSDEGIVLRYGDGTDSCDVFGAREAVVNKVGDTYFLFYDGAGRDGWKACLAESRDLKKWEKKGAILQLGDSTKNDSKSASSPWVIESDGVWHMFYMGTPNTSPPPYRVPSFPYLTMKAQSKSLEGPWVKQYDVVPFSTIENTYYSSTASPGFIIKTKDGYLQFFSSSFLDSKGTHRTLGLATTKNLNGPWKVSEKPLFPASEQVENSSLYFDEKLKTWFLFTNHIGITTHGEEYTDAIWVYWSKNLYSWNKDNKAIVLDSENCLWAKGAIGMPSVIQVGDKLALLYDAPGGESISHMHRNIGLAWIKLPLDLSKIK